MNSLQAVRRPRKGGETNTDADGERFCFGLLEDDELHYEEDLTSEDKNNPEQEFEYSFSSESDSNSGSLEPDIYTGSVIISRSSEVSVSVMFRWPQSLTKQFWISLILNIKLSNS